jgi:hypothetical protein
VIPAMDHIDETLTNNSFNPAFEPSIRAALGIAKKSLNRYYNTTDQSEVYRIAMGMCVSIVAWVLTCILNSSVLHPRHKLKYFEQAGWEPGWIRTAEEIVRAVFESSYAMPADDDEVPLPNVSQEVCVLYIFLKFYSLIV